MKAFLDYQLYIFDLDNTLYNENDYLFGAYDAIGEELGKIEYADFLKTTFLNEGRTELFNKLTARFSLGGSTIEKALEILRSYQPEKRLQLFSHIVAVLDQLKAHHKQLALLTNGNAVQQRNKVNSIEPSINSYFSLIVYANEIAPKPSPLSVEHILQQKNTEKDNCLMIGDAESDALAAKNAGVDFIYVNDLM